jgi:hypothetical protein
MGRDHRKAHSGRRYREYINAVRASNDALDAIGAEGMQPTHNEVMAYTATHDVAVNARRDWAAWVSKDCWT